MKTISIRLSDDDYKALDAMLREMGQTRRASTKPTPKPPFASGESPLSSKPRLWIPADSWTAPRLFCSWRNCARKLPASSQNINSIKK